MECRKAGLRLRYLLGMTAMIVLLAGPAQAVPIAGGSYSIALSITDPENEATNANVAPTVALSNLTASQSEIYRGGGSGRISIESEPGSLFISVFTEAIGPGRAFAQASLDGRLTLTNPRDHPVTFWASAFVEEQGPCTDSPDLCGGGLVAKVDDLQDQRSRLDVAPDLFFDGLDPFISVGAIEERELLAGIGTGTLVDSLGIDDFGEFFLNEITLGPGESITGRIRLRLAGEVIWVPEPDIFAMILFGLGTLLVIRRRGSA